MTHTMATAAGTIFQRSSQMRMIVLVDTQANGLAPVLGDVLGFNNPTPTGGFGTAGDPACLVPRNPNNFDRYRFIIDKTYTFGCYQDQAAEFAAPRNEYAIRFHKKVNIPVQFNGTNGTTVASIVSGAVWILFFDDLNHIPGANDGTFFKFSSRCYYKE